MKNKAIIKLLPLLLTLNAAGQTAAERLELGVQLQTADQNFEGAITEYKAVLKAAAKSERLAAEAHYRLAECFFAKGKEELAKTHLKNLRRNFSADNKWVKRSQDLLPPHHFQTKPWVGDWICRYDVKTPNGKSVGSFITGERVHGNVLEFVDIRTSGGRGVSQAFFNLDNYTPISIDAYLFNMGSNSVTFSDYQNTSITLNAEGKAPQELESSGGRLLFENQQIVQLIRSLNQEVGTTQQVSVISAFFASNAGINFDLKVDSHVAVTTEAGTFDCAKITTNLNQTFYISTDEKRLIVKMEIGAIPIELQSREEWLSQSHTHIMKGLGGSFEFPAELIVSGVNSSETMEEARFWSSDLIGHEYVLDARKLDKTPDSPRAYAETLHEEVRGKGIFNSFDVVEGSWKEFEVAGHPASGVRLTGTVGELKNYEYHVVILKENVVFSFYVDYGLKREEEAIARLHEIVSSLKF